MDIQWQYKLGRGVVYVLCHYGMAVWQILVIFCRWVTSPIVQLSVQWSGTSYSSSPLGMVWTLGAMRSTHVYTMAVQAGSKGCLCIVPLWNGAKQVMIKVGDLYGLVDNKMVYLSSHWMSILKYRRYCLEVSRPILLVVATCCHREVIVINY